MTTATSVAVVLLAGCGAVSLPGSGAGAGDGVDTERMREVAEDEGATASDIVEAGSAVGAGSVGGAVLVTYSVRQGTSEGRSAAAWRLYDGEGRGLATGEAGVSDEGAAYAGVVAVPEGFLVVEADGPVRIVGADGSSERIRAERGAGTSRAGDVALDDGSTRVYRPGSRTVLTPAPRPPGNRQGWALTDDGTQWLQRLGRTGRIPFSRSTPSGRWEPAATYAPGRGRVVNSLALTAVGDDVVVPLTAEGPDLEQASLVGLLVRPSAAPADRPWRLLEGDDAGDGWWDARAAALDDTTAVVGTGGEAPYLVDLATGVWKRMEAPTDEDDWDYDFQDGRAFAFHSDHADAWFSDDRGASWSRLPH